MSEEKMQTSPFEYPAWFDGKKINETVFCEEFLRDYPMVTVNDCLLYTSLRRLRFREFLQELFMPLSV